MRLLPTDLSADLILRVRPEAYDASFDELAHDVDRAVEQLTRWSATHGEGVPAS